eukprot:PhM_4_TR1987/c0_g1_i1/m.97895
MDLTEEGKYPNNAVTNTMPALDTPKGPILSKAERRRLDKEASGNVPLKVSKDEAEELKRELKERKRHRRSLKKGSAGRKRDFYQNQKREREEEEQMAQALGDTRSAKRRKM